VSGDCLCLNLGIECWCTRRGPGGFGYAAHGTKAGARRHYRRDGKGWQCRPCRQAEARDWQDRQKREPGPARDWADGPRIRTLRLAAGMTQEELAAALGVKSRALSGWETGRARPSAGMADRAAAVTAQRNRPPAVRSLANADRFADYARHRRDGAYVEEAGRLAAVTNRTAWRYEARLRQAAA